jgi:thiamine biosynthesis lipoprotein
MGIDARIVVYATSKREADSAVEAAYNRIAALDTIMSDYRPASELNQLCAKAGTGPIKVSADLFRVLERAQQIAMRSDGRFDVTVGPLVQLWRKARKDGRMPDAADLQAAKALVGWEKLHLDARARTAQLDTPGMKLDLGGIAKGYASDEALKVLRRRGVSIALIEMGGDLVLGDAPPKTRGWRVDVPNARQIMYLQNGALSSSGDTEQYVVIDGVRYSHVVDPKTGLGLTNRFQVSVWAPNGFLTDPLSTALTLLDENGRTKLLSHYPGVRSYLREARN